LDHTWSTAAWSSRLTSWREAERSAATATERASLGSFLFTARVASSRTPGAELGLHIQHLLTGGQQLLGQQVSCAAGALYRPRICRDELNPEREGGV
jgi:hypothetical protein